MSNRQNDTRHNQEKPRGVNNQDPQAHNERETNDWKDAQLAQDPDAPGGKRRKMTGEDHTDRG